MPMGEIRNIEYSEYQCESGSQQAVHAALRYAIEKILSELERENHLLLGCLYRRERGGQRILSPLPAKGRRMS